jgi:hypothetical protein
MWSRIQGVHAAETAKQAAKAAAAPMKKNGRPTDPNSTRSIKKQRDELHSGVVASVVELLQKRKTSLTDVLNCTAGSLAFPALSGLRLDVEELTVLATNVGRTLTPGEVGGHSNKALHGSLLQGVSKTIIQKYCTGVNYRFAANAKVPSYIHSDSYRNAGLFTEHYSHGVTRQKIHDGEISAELHWATTVEFHSHSGDTTETYYRTDSKVSQHP